VPLCLPDAEVPATGLEDYTLCHWDHLKSLWTKSCV
jgi:hypothetical protein